MFSIFRLVRIQNLVFIAFIQYIIRQSILIPILQKYGFETIKDNSMLVLLILSTIFIAAGGYVLNDYFDIKIDAINRPEKQVVGKIITRQKAMLIHQILTGVGVIIGLILAYFAHSFTLAFIFVVIPGLLWFYSSSYKRQFIVGNLIVALISAITILVVGIMEMVFLESNYGNLIFETPIPKELYAWVGGFALFSFLTTFIREIIKDMEDVEGDKEMECRTIAIKWGEKKTKNLLYFFIIFTNALLYFFEISFIPFEGSLTLRYLFIGISIPSIVLIYMLYKSNSPQEYHSASSLVKGIMLIGILYAPVFYFLMAKTYDIAIFNLFMIAH